MRYSRQELLIGKKAQKKIRKSNVTIVGLGALGTVVAELLTRAGIGKLILIDRDFIECHNLQRQSLFIEMDVGKAKAAQAKEALEKINSKVKIEAHVTDLDYENIKLIKSDLILDCTDNIETRLLLNDFCLKNNIPWIYASAIKNQGYIFNIIPKKTCFRCIFKETSGLGTCDTEGVLNTITSLIASIQVSEAFKILLNQDYEKNLIYINLDDNSFKKIKIKKDPKCLACKREYEYLEGKNQKDIIKFCGTDNYQIKKGKFDYNKVRERLKKIDFIYDTGYCFTFHNLTVFKDHRVLIKSKDEKEAKTIYSKYIGN